MNEAHYRFLSLRGELPARLTAEQTAWVLNCQPHDIPGLIASRLLKPLGKPPTNGTKYFSAVTVAALAKDEKRLSCATLAITEFWRQKNASRKQSAMDLTPAVEDHR